MSDSWTILRLLDWTTEFLQKHGATRKDARLDAEVLLAAARGCRRIDLYTAFDEEPPESVRTKYKEMIRQRAAGAPAAYLVGQKEFFSLPFQVTPAVLIPGPDTETLVAGLLDLIKQQADPERTYLAADVGTGSGCVAIAAAKRCAQLQLIAIDISPEALAVARQNAHLNNVNDRISFLESDLFLNVAEAERFDYVVSNPPYIRTEEFPTLTPEVRDHEPRLALDGGPTGMGVISRLIPESASRLKPGGWLLMEVGHTQQSEVEKLLAADGHFEVMPPLKDLAGIARVVCGRKI